MKKALALFVFFIFHFVSEAQVVQNDLGSIVQSLDKLTNDLNYSNHVLNSNIAKYQKQRKTAVGFIFAGIVVSVLGYTAMLSTSNLDDSEAKTGAINLIALGGASTVTGSIVLLDAGKWITTKKRKKGNYVDIEMVKGINSVPVN